MLGLLLFVSEEASTDQAHCAAEENSCEYDQGEARRHDQVSARKGSIDSQDKTESNGATDQSSVPHEGQLRERQSQWIVLLISAKLQQANESNRGASTADDSHKDQVADQRRRERHRAIREEGQAQVGKDETFSQEAQELEDNIGGCLALGREIVPSVVGHSDTTDQKGNDAGLMHHLGDDVGDVGHSEDNGALSDRASSQ